MNDEYNAAQRQEGAVFHAALSFRNVRHDLGNRQLLHQVAERIISHFHLSVVDVHWHYFAPIGITGVYVLSQSSLTLHTWPEFKKLVVDVTTCGTAIDLHQIVPELKEILAAEDVIWSAGVF
jgi:S-adenosylmethionine decarboxylase